MKKIAVLLLSVLALTSCIFDDDGNYLSDYSTVVNVIDKNTLKSDEGLVFNVTSACDYNFTKYSRILIVCDITKTNGTGDNITSYDILLSEYAEVKVEPIVMKSDPDGANLGEDPANIYMAWYSGHYMNVQYSYIRVKESNVKHEIHLVCDDTKSDASKIYFSLTHDAFGETYSDESLDVNTLEIATETVSYDISSLISGKSGQVKLYFNWTWYEESDSGYLTRTIIPYDAEDSIQL